MLLWALGGALLVAYLVFYVEHVATLAAYPYDVDQGEGYDLNSGWLLLQGRPIYTDNAGYPYYSSNYPPVFSLLLAPLLAQTGLTLGAGRVFSATAALLTVLAIGVVVFRRAGSWPAALAAGLFYVGSNYVYHVTPLTRVNALATLFALTGLVCCWRIAGVGTGRSSSLWLIGAVVAFLLALFSKQTAIDAVAAGLLFLLVRERRVGLVATVTVGLVGAGVWLLLDAAHGGWAWVNVFVGNVNPFSVGQAVAYYRNFLELHAVLVGLAGWQAWRALRGGRWGPFELYWVFAMGLAVTAGKWGAGESYFLAPIVASCILAGVRLAEGLRDAGRHPWRDAALGGLVLLQALLVSHGPLNLVAPFLADRGAQAAVLARRPGLAEVETAAPLVEILRSADGPILAEDPGFALAAGKEIVGNATHLRNLHQAGAWRPDALVADLEARRFAWVVLDAELYPEPVLAAIGRSYYLFETYEINGTTQQLFAPGEE